MKKIVVAVAVLLLLLLVSGGAYVLLSRSAGRVRAPVRHENANPETGPPPAVVDVPPVSAPEAAPAKEVAAPSASQAPASPKALGDPGPAPAAETVPANAQPAFRHNPRSPPPPKPGSVRMGGGRGGFGPTGGWSKFPPARPKGPATLVATVLDRDGVPVPSADVYLGPPDVAGESAVSFGDLFRAGKTDAHGKLTRNFLPEGAAAAAPNLEGLLNGRRGLDARSAKKVLLSASRPASVELRLPFALADLGGVEGTVRDSDGNLLPSVAVMSGFRRVYTDAAGHFTLPRLVAGSRQVSAQRYGYQSETKEIEISGGQTAEADFTLAFRETGSLALSATVVGPDGEAVPGASVYLIATSGMGSGTIRSGKTDASGQFQMNGLPDRLRDAKVRLQANATGYRPANQVLEEGWPGTSVKLVLPERYVRLTLDILDAKSEASLDRCRLSVKKPGETTWRDLLSSYTDSGKVGVWLSAGTANLLVEAPDHESRQVTLDLAPPGGRVAYTVKLLPMGPPSQEVALTVRLTSATTGDPVKVARVEILPEHEDGPVQVLDTTRDDGVFTLPAPSGTWRLKITAKGYVTWLDGITLSATEKATTRAIRLTSK